MLKLERLESREVPANLIPGWTGAEQHIQGDVNADGILDTIAVAQEGGSARVQVVDGKTGANLGGFIAFDPSFRGGGNAFVAQASPGHPADLLVVPGPGGGPVVEEYQFKDGGFQVVNNTLLPFPEEFRGGLQVSAGPISDLNGPQDAFFLPGSGGGPEFVAMNLDTGSVDAQFWVGDPSDLSGDVNFESTGGVIQTPGHKLGVVIQQGPVVDFEVPTRIYDLPSGLDVTSEFGGPLVG